MVVPSEYVLEYYIAIASLALLYRYGILVFNNIGYIFKILI